MHLNFTAITETLKLHRHLLLAGTLLGGVAAACDAKTIGDESAGNLTCQDGAMKDAGDGCNTCTCSDGEWACTEKGCEGCVDGDVKEAGDGCNTCTCWDGEWGCTLLGCPATEGGTCGDGLVEGAEECDDGNNVDGDGCSASCIPEGDTTGGEPDTATTGETDTGGETDHTTGVTACGDGIVDAFEECDDGNTVDGDGCSASCQVEGGAPLFCAEPVASDPFTITSAAIVADTLLVDVQYGGGCETHVFSYCWDGLFAESEPVQIWTKISHDGNDDPCDALPMEALEFDLSGLKQAYQDAYQTQSGEITVHLDDWGQSLAYVF